MFHCKTVKENPWGYQAMHPDQFTRISEKKIRQVKNCTQITDLSGNPQMFNSLT